jgi:hypothetical protein
MLPKKECSGGVNIDNQQFPGMDLERLNAPIRSKNQLMIVAKIPGTPSLTILLNALLAITFLASSARPSRASLSGLTETTYPDMTKKTPTARYPPCNTNRP